MALAVALLLILTHKLVIYAFTVTCYIVHSTILMVHWALKGKSNCTTQKQKSTRQDAEKGLEISAEENSTGIFECPTVAVHYANVFPKPRKTPPHNVHIYCTKDHSIIVESKTQGLMKFAAFQSQMIKRLVEHSTKMSSLWQYQFYMK